MRWQKITSMLGIGLAVQVCGCRDTAHSGELEGAAVPWRRAGREHEPFPRRFAVGAGGVIQQEPRRIVAASVLSAEVALALAPRERFAGVHYLAADLRYSAAAELVQDVPRLGAEPEHILSARPDLVIVDAFTKTETLALLAYAGVPVCRTQEVASLGDIEDNIRRIGWVIGCDANAEDLIGRMEMQMRQLDTQEWSGAATKDSGLQAWHVLQLNGALDTYGAGSVLDDLLHRLGVHNLAAERGVGPFRKLDIEAVLSWRPDALIVSGMPGETAKDVDWIRQTPGLALLPCVQKGHVVVVPGALLASTSQHIAAAAIAIRDTLAAWRKP